MHFGCIKPTRIALLLIAFVGAGPLFAHHSQAMFDLTKTVTIEGTVSEVDWANPHVWFYVDGSRVGVANDPVQHWALEGQSPGFLTSNGEGWQRDTLKVGDKISATGNARKDGKPSMLLLTLTVANGKKFTSKSPFK